MLAISQLQAAWLQDITALYHKHPEATTLLTKLVVQVAPDDHYTLRDGLIRYKQRIGIPADSSFTAKIIEAFHASPVAGHSGIPVTTNRIKALFCWKGIKQQIQQWVNECVVCQRAKPERVRYPRLLAPLSVPSQF